MNCGFLIITIIPIAHNEEHKTKYNPSKYVYYYFSSRIMAPQNILSTIREVS